MNTSNTHDCSISWYNEDMLMKRYYYRY